LLYPSMRGYDVFLPFTSCTLRVCVWLVTSRELHVYHYVSAISTPHGRDSQVLLMDASEGIGIFHLRTKADTSL
jgi:hypothetical protein